MHNIYIYVAACFFTGMLCQFLLKFFGVPSNLATTHTSNKAIRSPKTWCWTHFHILILTQP